MFPKHDLPFSQTPRIQRQSETVQRMKKLAQEALQKASGDPDQPAVKKQCEFIIPGSSESSHAIPNYIARSSIFAPVRRGWNRMHDETVFIETPTVLLKGSGKQLNEDHADIWMHAIFLQTTALPGDMPVINRADFLRGMGRNTSGASYKWLQDGLNDLARFSLTVEARKRDGTIKYSFGRQPSCRVLHMLGGFDYCTDTGTYKLAIDRRWGEIFGNHEYTLVDWTKRLQMKQDLTKSLQRLVGTSSDVQQKYSLEILKTRAQSISPVRKFRQSLERSLKELEALGVIADPRIQISPRGIEQASWVRLER